MFKSFFCGTSRQYRSLVERDLKSDLSLKNIIENKEITEDILPSTDVHCAVQKLETGRTYPEEEGESRKICKSCNFFQCLELELCNCLQCLKLYVGKMSTNPCWRPEICYRSFSCVKGAMNGFFNRYNLELSTLHSCINLEFA